MACEPLNADSICPIGNLVLIQASGQWHQQSAVFYTLLRLEERKVAEQ